MTTPRPTALTDIIARATEASPMNMQPRAAPLPYDTSDRTLPEQTRIIAHHFDGDDQTPNCVAALDALRLLDDFSKGAITTDEAAALWALAEQQGRRVAMLEAKPAAIDWKADLYTRLTSRPLWTMFILPTVITIVAATSGEISWTQAILVIAGSGGGFGLVERAKDTVVAAKSTPPAPPAG